MLSSTWPTVSRATRGTAEVELATTEIPHWDAAQQYSYTLTVSASSLTLTWKVKPWDTKDTEVSWGPDETTNQE